MKILYALLENWSAVFRPVRFLLTGAWLVLLDLAACTHSVGPIAHTAAGRVMRPYQAGALRPALLPVPGGRMTGVPVMPRAALPAGTTARGMAGIWADLRRRSYYLAVAAHAPAERVADNQDQHLSAHLAPASYTLSAAAPRTARGRPVQPPEAPKGPAAPTWQVRLTLRSIGRGSAPAFVPAAQPTLITATDTSVRYGHGAAFATEYVNTPAGVRQNYYLVQRPAGRRGSIRVTLALTTTLRPVARADGQAVDFQPAQGGAAVLHYAGLRAWDATGRTLPTRLYLRSATILALEVNDAYATYPLTIDPLASTPNATLNDPNTTSTSDYFGVSVAGAGDVNGDGYADVLVRAYEASTTTNTAASGNGRAYLYLGSSTGLTSAPSATLNDPNSISADNGFGYSVAGAGDVNGDGYADVIVGAAYASTTLNAAGTGNGRAYLYLGSSTGLTNIPSATLNDPNTTPTNDQFGTSVAGTGDVNGDGYADVIVGAREAATTPNTTGTDNGRAYLYLGSSSGLVDTPNATLTDPNTVSTQDYFGISAVGAGDVNGDGYADVIIGANHNQAATTTNAAATNAGQAYLYLGSSNGLTGTPSAMLNDPNTTVTPDQFGISVAGAGDVSGDGYADVLVGARGAATTTNAAATDNGRSYLYLGNQGAARPGGSLRLYNTDLTTLLTQSNKPNAQFGLGLNTRSVQGRVRARLVWEVAANGVSFMHASPITNSVRYSGRGPWTNLPLAGTELKALVSKVGHTNRVRARLEYATASPLLASTSFPPNGTGGVGGTTRYGPWQYVVAQQLTQLNALPLPVVLVAFTATAEGPAAVRLAWTTALEKNSATFEIERSADGTVFTLIGTVAAAGSSSAPNSYTLRDGLLPMGSPTLYYRLRQVDADGTAAYSPVRTMVLNGQSGGLTLAPNPARLTALAGAPPHAPVTVFDTVGRLVFAATADANGAAVLALPAYLPGGVYVVRSGVHAVRLAVE